MPPRRSPRKKRGALREYHHPPFLRNPPKTKAYTGKWIAVWKQRIIDSDKDLEALCNRLEAVGLEEKVILFKVLPPGMIWA